MRRPWHSVYRNILVEKDGRRVRTGEHRHVMEVHLGRDLAKNEIVHHKNNRPGDNRLENLQVMTFREHRRLHGREQRDLEREERMGSLRRNGATLNEIAIKFGVSRQRIYQILSRASAKARRRRKAAA